MNKSVRYKIKALIKKWRTLGIRLGFVESYHTEFVNHPKPGHYDYHVHYDLVLYDADEEEMSIWSSQLEGDPDFDEIEKYIRRYCKMERIVTEFICDTCGNKIEVGDKAFELPADVHRFTCIENGRSSLEQVFPATDPSVVLHIHQSCLLDVLVGKKPGR